MKVSTDSCILGAWFAGKLSHQNTVLDIGAGTGLQMLMMAQKNRAHIDGIELDQDAWQQAKENIESSAWKDRLTIYSGDIRTYPFDRKYQFIISNPPFYENDLESPSVKKNQTRHAATLNFQELLSAVERLLEPDGSFGLLLPYHRKNDLLEYANVHSFWPGHQLNIRQTPRHNFFRSVIWFSKTKPAKISNTELIILDEAGKYTDDFVNLMKDYYLWL